MFITFKRWTLKEGCSEEDVVALVRDAIVPAYNRLPGCLGFGLMRVEGTNSYLATQKWESHAAYNASVSSEAYSKWRAGYFPTLGRWEEMMTFEEGWEAVDLLN